MGSEQASVRKPLPAVGRLPGKGRREGRRIWVLGGGQSDALRQFVILTGTKDKSVFWARSRDCPRSDLNPERTNLERILKKKLPLSWALNLYVLRRLLCWLRHISCIKGRGS